MVVGENCALPAPYFAGPDEFQVNQGDGDVLCEHANTDSGSLGGSGDCHMLEYVVKFNHPFHGSHPPTTSHNPAIREALETREGRPWEAPLFISGAGKGRLSPETNNKVIIGDESSTSVP